MRAARTRSYGWRAGPARRTSRWPGPTTEREPRSAGISARCSGCRLKRWGRPRAELRRAPGVGSPTTDSGLIFPDTGPQEGRMSEESLRALVASLRSELAKAHDLDANV